MTLKRTAELPSIGGQPLIHGARRIAGPSEGLHLRSHRSPKGNGHDLYALMASRMFDQMMANITDSPSFKTAQSW